MVVVWGTVCVALVWSAALVVTDLRELRLPDRLTLPAVPVVWGLAGILGGVVGLSAALAGAGAWWGLCVLPGRVSARFRTGGGDAKLALSLGAVSAALGGVAGWWIAVTGASVLTLVLAAAGAVGRAAPVARGVRKRCPEHRGRSVVPHGPGMLVASWISILLTM